METASGGESGPSPAGSGLLGGIVFAIRGCLHLLVPLPQAGVAAAGHRAGAPRQRAAGDSAGQWCGCPLLP